MEMKKEHIGWIDLLRVIACFLVVFSHCCDPFVARFDDDRGAFLTGVFSGSLVRPCVPLFVMMTGVLLFPVRTGMGEFYRRRIGRVLVPLAFWSVALPVLFYLYLNYGCPATANPAIVAEGHDGAGTLAKLYTYVFNFNFDTTPLWYLYMLVGLYLVMPVLDAWLERASRRDIRLFLGLWGVSLFIPYIQMLAPVFGYTGNYGNMGIWGVCDWNAYGTFYYFSGFAGYLVLARYLIRYPLAWSLRRTLCIAVPMFVAGYLVTSLGYVLAQRYFPGNYAYLEIVWYFTGINVFMMTFPVFVLVQRIKVPSCAFLSTLSSLTFGIYLCHFVFVAIAYDCFDIASLPYIVRILAMACCAFAASALLVWGMDRFPLTRRLVR